MPGDISSSEGARWTRVIERTRVTPSQPAAVKLRGKHIALFVHDGEVLACNNRCPHEGYPLVEGALDANCVLTCHWHNWKFDLRSGATLYGGDNLRVYPVKVEAGDVYVDLREPPAAARIEKALAHLGHAIAEFDTARIARELARLGKAGAGPEVALARAIEATHDRLEDGMTHAYAAADAWLALADSFATSATRSAGFVANDAKRLTCATEALVYIAYDTLREPKHPYSDGTAPFSAASFAAAVEAQDEDAAITLVNGALAGGLHYDDLEAALVRAPLAHYNDFGHSLIYVTHVRQLVARLGAAVEAPLLKAWARSLVYATREDLLRIFGPTAMHLRHGPPARPSRALFAIRACRGGLRRPIRARSAERRSDGCRAAAAAISISRSWKRRHATSYASTSASALPRPTAWPTTSGGSISRTR
jgi:nitrite reductase/ring-hydroxylating ferredoxin subunit